VPTTESATAPAVARLQQVRGGQEALVRRLTLFAPVVLVLFVVAAYYAAPGLGLRGPALLVTVSTALFVVAVLGRNATTARSPAHLGFVGVLVATSVALMCVQPAGPGPAGMLLAVLCVARLLPVRVGVPVLVVGFVGLEVFETVTGQQYVTILVLGSLAALYGLMYLAHRLVAANRQAERLLAELHESRLAQAQAAGLAERQRLAREMHDVLAHSLSGLMLQLEGARMLVEGDPADPRLRATVERAHHLCRTGLDEARRAIGTLRDDDLPGPERLPALAEAFGRDHGVACDYVETGTPQELGSQARLAVYRVAQEALTNVARHAAPDRVEMRLDWTGHGRVRLTVEDVGSGNAGGSGAAGGGGYGLTGMRERAELLGGTLDAGPTGHGFRVTLEVPVGAEVAA
jgi:signal transduction histidine kinase